MTQNRFYSSVAPPTTLTSPLGATGSPQIQSIQGLPASFPYTLLIDWGLSSQEAVSVTAAPTGSGPYTITCTRGIDGTTAQGHNTGAIVVHGVTAEDYNEPQVHIATGTSGASYPNVIHGLASGSSVVGTTDTQTLSNKTIAGASFTGAVTLSASGTTAPLILLTNTHAAPTAVSVRLVANAAGDKIFGFRVSGDTADRYQQDSNGKTNWGPGGGAALDTDLYRSGIGILQTDNTFAASALTVSESSGSGKVVTVTNTQSAPSNASVVLTAQAAADSVVAVQVSADTVARHTIDSNGKLAWGAGGSSATDTDLYRQGASVLTTDDTFTALLGAQFGANAPALGGGSGGVVGMTNATAAPNATSISNGIAVYSSGGVLNYMNANGYTQRVTGSQLAGTVTYANSVTETALGSLSVTANDPVTGAVYQIRGFGIVSTTGTPTITWNTRWGGTTGTLLNGTSAITQGSGVTNLPFSFSILVMFMSSTTCIASQKVDYFTAAGTVPTTNYQQGTSLTTVTTSSVSNLVFSAVWGTASSSNTLTSWYSAERIS